jgi:hypothetical protein
MEYHEYIQSVQIFNENDLSITIDENNNISGF